MQMSGDPQHSGDRITASAAPGGRFEDVELHRVDLAARLLALKHAALAAEALIEHAAAETRGLAVELDAVMFIAEMVRVSALRLGDEDGARSLLAAERLAELLAALDDPADAVALRGLRRRGELDRPLPMPAQRRIRRACWRVRPADGAAATLEPLPTPVWDGLLDALARSLAIDRDAEVWADVGLDGLAEAELAARRDRVRAALLRGAQRPIERSSGRGLAYLDSEPALATGGEQAAPHARELLPAGHRVGRFTLLHRLGVGAMGVVYAAYDPELDRRIAVKLLRARAGPGAARAQARLLREAQAMARLTHPNVAVVHDVGTHEGAVFVAMEFVRGATLQAWLRAAPRSWREVVDVFLQAGRGLAAAHAAGLVHRDFKPANAMIGDDGRVRVLDFGLCYAESTTDSAERTRDDPSDIRITHREEVVGTPAYMPPEQFLRGGVVGPASDQFSFCASLYEALHGQLPFAGATIPEVSRAILRGELRPPPRGTRVPGWLHAIVQRGVKREAAQRFPTMDALLRALDRGRVRARGGIAVAVAVAVGTGLGGFLAARSQGAEVDICSGGAAQISGVWTDERRGAAERALAAAGPAFAAEIWPRVAGELDRYAGAWQDMHRDACEAHQRGETSGALLDRRMACLEQRKAALKAATAVLAEADGDVALHALELVARLPPLERCGDLAALEADVPPPSDPEVRAAVDALRLRVARVQALEHAGLPTAALTLADDVVRDAEALGERGVLAEALLQRGRLGINRIDLPKGQDAWLTRAYLIALGSKRDELATEALALRMFTRGRGEGKTALAFDDLAVAQEMLARLPTAGAVRGLVLNNAGAVYMASGDAPRAAELFREALAAREAALGPDHVEVALTLANLAMISPPNERVPLLQRALEILDHALGRAHPQTVDLRLAAGFYAQDPREAVALVAPGCEALGRFSQHDRAQRARCLSYLGNHAAESGDEVAAANAFREVAELLTDAGELSIQPAELAQLRGRAYLYTRAYAPAIAELRAQLATLQPSDEWWQQRGRAELELLLGLHLQRTDDPAGARDTLEAAIRGFEAAAAHAPDVLLQQRLAEARSALAALLLSGKVGPDRVADGRNLRSAAEQWYRGSGPGYAWRLDNLRALGRSLATP